MEMEMELQVNGETGKKTTGNTVYNLLLASRILTKVLADFLCP